MSQGAIKMMIVFLALTILWVEVSTALSTNQLPNLKAAVVVPGFLTGAEEFKELVDGLNEKGIATIAVPMPNWHWIPCLGGRSARPVLERIDFTVRHLAANGGNVDAVPPFGYNLIDLWKDFWSNPGGVSRVGGSDKVDDYPVVQPSGSFPRPSADPKGKIALVGHSAGGWISRVYLSSRSYGGKAYKGTDLVHSLVTLGTPNSNADGPAFEGIQWVNREGALPIRQLAVGGNGYMGGEWGSLTQGAYSFCCPDGTDGTGYDGDGVTPIQCALSLDGAEKMALSDVTHFCWSDVFGGDLVSPKLTKAHKEGAPWYGSRSILDQWASWLERI